MPPAPGLKNGQPHLAETNAGVPRDSSVAGRLLDDWRREEVKRVSVERYVRVRAAGTNGPVDTRFWHRGLRHHEVRFDHLNTLVTDGFHTAAMFYVRRPRVGHRGTQTLDRDLPRYRSSERAFRAAFDVGRYSHDRAMTWVGVGTEPSSSRSGSPDVRADEIPSAPRGTWAWGRSVRHFRQPWRGIWV